MKYYEQGCLFENLPGWVVSSIRLGYTLVTDQKVSSKKIHLISSPFESSIAPLISLGALRAALEQPEANLCNDYFNFLSSAREKILQAKNDAPKQWHIKKYTEPDKEYYFTENLDSTGIIVTGKKTGRGRRKGESLKSWIMPSYAKEWQLNGLPIPCSSSKPEPFLIKVLQSLPLESGVIKHENLISSFLGHILVSTSSGHNSTYMNSLRESGFSLNGKTISLADLLMLGEGSTSAISRIALIGERQLSEHTFYQEPSLIIAQGARETVRVWDRFSAISGANIVGVINRCGSREALEEFESILQDKQRYYQEISPPVNFQSPYIQIRSMERI